MSRFTPLGLNKKIFQNSSVFKKLPDIQNSRNNIQKAETQQPNEEYFAGVILEVETPQSGPKKGSLRSSVVQINKQSFKSRVSSSKSSIQKTRPRCRSVAQQKPQTSDASTQTASEPSLPRTFVSDTHISYTYESRINLLQQQLQCKIKQNHILREVIAKKDFIYRECSQFMQFLASILFNYSEKIEQKHKVIHYQKMEDDQKYKQNCLMYQFNRPMTVLQEQKFNLKLNDVDKQAIKLLKKFQFLNEEPKDNSEATLEDKMKDHLRKMYSEEFQNNIPKFIVQQMSAENQEFAKKMFVTVLRKGFKNLANMERKIQNSQKLNQERYSIIDLHQLDKNLVNLYKSLQKLTNKQSIKTCCDLKMLLNLQDQAQNCLICIIDLQRFDQFNIEQNQKDEQIMAKLNCQINVQTLKQKLYKKQLHDLNQKLDDLSDLFFNEIQSLKDQFLSQIIDQIMSSLNDENIKKRLTFETELIFGSVQYENSFIHQMHDKIEKEIETIKRNYKLNIFK